MVSPRHRDPLPSSVGGVATEQWVWQHLGCLPDESKGSFCVCGEDVWWRLVCGRPGPGWVGSEQTGAQQAGARAAVDTPAGRGLCVFQLVLSVPWVSVSTHPMRGRACGAPATETRRSHHTPTSEPTVFIS